MAPRNPAIHTPLGALNQNIQRAMLLNGSAQKSTSVPPSSSSYHQQGQEQHSQSHYSGVSSAGANNSGVVNVVTMPVTTSFYHNTNNNANSNAGGGGGGAAAPAVMHSQHHYHHADPFQDAGTVFNGHRTAARNANGANSAAGASGADGRLYYQQMFADTNVDDLFGPPSASHSRSHSRHHTATNDNSSRPPATVPYPAAPNHHHHHADYQGHQSDAINQDNPSKSILVKKTKYGGGSEPSVMSTSALNSRCNSAASSTTAASARRTATKRGSEGNASSLAGSGGGVGPLLHSSTAVDAYSNSSYYSAKGTSVNRCRSEHSAASEGKSKRGGGAAAAGGGGGGITFVSDSATSHTHTNSGAVPPQHQQHHLSMLRPQQLHPAHAARRASRSVAIADDAPAVIMRGGNPNTANINTPHNLFTPARQTFSYSTNNAHTHHTAAPATTATTAATASGASSTKKMSSSTTTPHHNQISSASAPSSCVKVGGTFVPVSMTKTATGRRSRSNTANVTDHNTINNAPSGGDQQHVHRRLRNNAMPSVSAYNNSSNNAKRGRSAEGSAGNHSNYDDCGDDGNRFDGCYYEDEHGNGNARTKARSNTNNPYSLHIPSDGSEHFAAAANGGGGGPRLMTGVVALPPQLRILLGGGGGGSGAEDHNSISNASTRRRRGGATQQSDDADLTSPLLHAGFTVKPLWSLVGTFKTGLQHMVDVRGGLAMRWLQRNPKGGHQRLTIPLNMIVLSAITVVRVEAPNPSQEILRQQEAEAEEEQRRLSYLATGRRDPNRNNNNTNNNSRAGSVSSSRRSTSRSAARSSAEVGAARGVQGNHTLPSYLRGKGGVRALTANSSTSSWAVVIRTVDMKPSQVTFGFGSAMEAQRFKLRLLEVARHAQEYI